MKLRAVPKMSLIYLDQNALISLGKRARTTDFRKRLDSFFSARTDAIVLSFWHLVETSYGRNPERSGELADFIESLDPAWLVERHEILRLDVLDDFCKHLRLDHEPTPRVVSRSEMFAGLDRQTGGPSFRGTLRQFVALWRKHRLEVGYEESAKVADRMRRAKKSGKVTPQATVRAARELIRSVLPKFTPSGLQIPPSTAKEYLSQVDFSSIPSVALDVAISGYEWAQSGALGTARNTLIDKVHLLSALPYADELVTDDHLFYGVHDVAKRTGHVRARLLECGEFLRRFEDNRLKSSAGASECSVPPKEER
jgi:hypothetical protein